MCSLNLILYIHAALDEMKWWQITVMVIAVIFCLIGVVLWITVGAVVSNLPDNGKCFPFQSSKISLHGTRGKSTDNVGKKTPTHKYTYM